MEKCKNFNPKTGKCSICTEVSEMIYKSSVQVFDTTDKKIRDALANDEESPLPEIFESMKKMQALQEEIFSREGEKICSKACMTHFQAAVTKALGEAKAYHVQQMEARKRDYGVSE